MGRPILNKYLNLENSKNKKRKNKMKKLLMIAIFAMLGLSLVACGTGVEIPDTDPDIIGQITEITEGGGATQLHITANDQNVSANDIVIALVGDETSVVLSDEKTEHTGNFLVGQIVKVYGNGTMTMSLPPQVPATVIVMLDTEPATVSNDGVANMLPEEGEGGPVADIPEAPHKELAITGTITEITEENGYPVLLVKAQDEADTANPEMKIMVNGDTVINNSETFFEPEVYEFEVGEMIDVYTNGITTRSIPPQATAMHIDLLDVPVD